MAVTFLDEVKTALRISSANKAYDIEVEGLINGACWDLALAGVRPEKIRESGGDPTDVLIKRAVITYCKANFGYDNPEAERFQKSYDSLKLHLLLSSEYGGDSDAV